jgi:hypothetical protein
MSKKATLPINVPSVGRISQSLMQKLMMRRPGSSGSNARGSINTFPSDAELESALREVFLGKVFLDLPTGVLSGSYLIPEASYKIQSRYSRKAILKGAIKKVVIRALERMVHDGKVRLRFDPYQSHFQLNYDREMVLDLPHIDE